MKNHSRNTTGLRRASPRKRHALCAVRLWPDEHALRTFLRRRRSARAYPRPARLGKRGQLWRRLGCKRADKRRQARAQQGAGANGTACARARGARSGRLVRKPAKRAQSRGAACRWWWPSRTRRWRRRTRCREERRENSDWASVEERRSAAIGQQAEPARACELHRRR